MSQIEYFRGKADDEAVGFWSRIFGVPRSEFVGIHDSFHPEDRLLLGAKCEGRLVGSVEVYRMEASWNGGSNEPWGCVGNVSTDPQFRGKRIAQTLLTQANEVLDQEWKCATGLLFTGVFDFYAQLGWRTVQGDFGVGTFKPGKYSPVTAVKSPDEALPEMVRLHQVWGVGGHLRAARTPLAWQTRVRTRLESKQVYLSDSAYVVIEKSGEGVTFVEVVGEPTALMQLCLGALAELSGAPLPVRFDCDVPTGMPEALEGFRLERGITGMVLPLQSRRSDFEGLRLVGLDRF